MRAAPLGVDPIRAVAWVILAFAVVAFPLALPIAKISNDQHWKTCPHHVPLAACGPSPAAAILTIGAIITGAGIALSLLLLAIRRPLARAHERRPCPYCAELILPEAVVCPYCRSELVARGEPTFGERLRR